MEDGETLAWLIRFCGEVFRDGAKHGDPEESFVPLELLTSKSYAAQRLELLRMATPRTPELAAAPYPGSNHVTVVDGNGDVATVLHSAMSLPWSNGLYVDGVQVWAGGGHFLRRMPEPGARATCYVAPTIIFDAHGTPVLAAGSPSISLLQNIVQNTLAILDLGVDIETSVHRPRFGGQTLASYLTPGQPPTYTIEVDVDAGVREDVKRRGVPLEVVGPWHLHHGSYEGIHRTADGTLRACADPRRSGLAEGV